MYYKIINEILIKNLNTFPDIINQANKIVSITVFNNHMIINENTISIVMTTHNRIQQTLFTLDTIKKSIYQNVQVIIIDDSPILMKDELLEKYPFRIDYVKINHNKKNWINPCLNYNIGFEQILGSKVIIQNSEVCHIGDILSYVNENLAKGKYLVFEVLNTASFDNNNLLYQSIDNLKNLISDPNCIWYQHKIYRNAKFHFLTAITAEDLGKIKGFDPDFFLGNSYDDNAFIFRLEYDLKLDIVVLNYLDTGLMGVHQHHLASPFYLKEKINKKDAKKLNRYILRKKIEYFNKYNVWPFLYNSSDIIDMHKKIFE